MVVSQFLFFLVSSSSMSNARKFTSSFQELPLPPSRGEEKALARNYSFDAAGRSPFRDAMRVREQFV